MNILVLQKHIAAYKKHLQKDREKHEQDLSERKQRTDYYHAWTTLLKMTGEKVGGIAIKIEKHYRLVPNEMLTDEEIGSYRQIE